MDERQNRILVIRGGAIGDFILTLPVFTALRQHFPKTHLEVLGYPHIAQLALAGGLVDKLQSIEARPLAGFFARGGQLDEKLRHYFGSCAVIISYLYDPDTIFRENVARCSRAQFIVGPHRPDECPGLHATQVLLKPLERLAIFGADPMPRLNVGQASRRSSRAQGNRKVKARQEAYPTLAVHPGSGSEKKNWPEAKWSDLLQDLLRTADLNFLMVGGEAEEGRLERLAATLPGGRHQIAHNLPLSELARRLSICAAYIGHDSGITHLAAALGLPTLVLWGQSVEATWRPLGKHVTIIRADSGLSALSVATVLKGLEHLRVTSVEE